VAAHQRASISRTCSSFRHGKRICPGTRASRVLFQRLRTCEALPVLRHGEPIKDHHLSDHMASHSGWAQEHGCPFLAGTDASYTGHLAAGQARRAKEKGVTVALRAGGR